MDPTRARAGRTSPGDTVPGRHRSEFDVTDKIRTTDPIEVGSVLQLAIAHHELCDLGHDGRVHWMSPDARCAPAPPRAELSALLV